MKEKSKIYLKTIGRFLMLWMGMGTILGISLALLGFSELRVFSGAICFIIGFLYARKKYIEEIKRIGEAK